MTDNKTSREIAPPDTASGASIGSTTFVRLFKPQFAPLVLSGQKRQTIRPTPKRMPKPGDVIDCREWTGRPYMSKQRKLGMWAITAIIPVVISRPWGITLRGGPLTPTEEWEFARADGFNTPQDMLEWFNVIHGLPFNGILIKW